MKCKNEIKRVTESKNFLKNCNFDNVNYNIYKARCPAGNDFIILGRERGKEKKNPVWQVKIKKEIKKNIYSFFFCK